MFDSRKYLATISPYLDRVGDKYTVLKPVFRRIAIRIMEVYEEAEE